MSDGRGGGGGTHTSNSSYKSAENPHNSAGLSSNTNGKQQEVVGVGTVIIPAGAKKIVQSLREVVNNVPDSEIYAALKDCNMDPNEAVNRLLTQDTFHEVKSKRDKKKENKDIPDTKSRIGTNTMHHTGKGWSERYLHGLQCTQHELKPGFRKENGIHGSTSSTMVGSNIDQRPSVNSDYMLAENKQSHTLADSSFSSSQNSGFQSSWMGVRGQVSMADVVKMGRPQNKAAVLPSHHNINQFHGSYGSHSFENNPSKCSETNWDADVAPGHNFDADDEWPSIEQPPTSMSSEPADSGFYADPSSLTLDEANPHTKSKTEDVQVTEQGHVDASVASRTLQEDDCDASNILDDNLYYRCHAHIFEDNDVENDASALTGNLQQLSLNNDDQSEVAEEDKPSVIIPNHLQVHGQDCSHLSFGSFGSVMGSGFSGPFSARSLKNDLDETSEVLDGPPTGLSDARSPDYHGDDHVGSAKDESLRHRAIVSSGSYDSTSVQQPELLKEETTEPSQESRYTFSSGYSYDSNEQLTAAFNNAQTSSQILSSAHFSNIMQAYSSSLSSNLLAASSVQTGREHDLSYSPFPQPMFSKYNNTASAVNGPTLSMSEALRAAATSSSQPIQQTHAGANVATGPALHQQMAVHPFSQPTLPLGHFANMIGYPFLPQSYTYMPSAFQQNFAGNSTYHQSLAALLPQYKNGVSVSSLPQSAPIASGYGFGNSNSVAGSNFPPPTAPSASALGYDDLLSSQYKERSHLLSSMQQQNDSLAMWVQQGAGSRSIPGNTYYSYQGQNQQAGAGGFRQAHQHPSQQFGYPNYYQSSSLSLEHQQQENAREGSLVGAQGQQPSKQTQQLWQSSY